jgi:hypothetical protein
MEGTATTKEAMINLAIKITKDVFNSFDEDDKNENVTYKEFSPSFFLEKPRFEIKGKRFIDGAYDCECTMSFLFKECEISE